MFKETICANGQRGALTNIIVIRFEDTLCETKKPLSREVYQAARRGPSMISRNS